MKSNYISRLSILIIALSFLWIAFNNKGWKNERFVGSDGFSYYMYLPALIIKEDIRLTFLDTDRQSYFNNLWFATSATNIRYTKMGCGLAYMQFPFFIAAHGIAKLTDYPADGFSLPYHFALSLSVIFYALLGLYLLGLSLLRFFSDKVTALVLFAVALGTNLLNYVVYDPMMSHAYSFFLFSLCIFATIRWHESPVLKNSLLLGFTCGLMIATRLPNGLFFLIPVLYRISDFQSIKNKLQFLTKNIAPLAIVLFTCAIIFFPQMYYWKITNGSWFFYSYTHEKFYFNSPHLIEGLFGFRKGWLIYTPIMILALAGIIWLKKYCRDIISAVWIYIPVNIYIVLSWWCWWYGGSFGMRSLIETYALLAFPMAAFFTHLYQQKKKMVLAANAITYFLIALNGFQTFQYKHQFITYDCMTWPAYKAVFLKWDHYPDHFTELQQCPDYDNAMLGLPERIKK